MSNKEFGNFDPLNVSRRDLLLSGLALLGLATEFTKIPQTVQDLEQKDSSNFQQLARDLVGVGIGIVLMMGASYQFVKDHEEISK